MKWTSEFQVGSRAEPFFHPGSRTGCLLVHGFTSTPNEMRWLGKKLADTWGFTVLGIRLAGHGTCMADLERTTWKDWLASVEDGYHFLRPNVDQLFVIGSSMGGALSLLTASAFPLAGVIGISTPYDLPDDKRLLFLPLLRPFHTKIKKGPPDWQGAHSKDEHIAYPFRTPHGILELNKLLVNMRQCLSRIKAPVLLFQSIKDMTIPQNSMESITARTTSTAVEQHWVHNSGHVITLEPDREFLAQTIAAFINKECKPISRELK
jgi:carboxylesterase